MTEFEIICVTMHQHDFSKVESMNVHSDILFANQCDYTGYTEIDFGEYKARMISTNTRGVGVNRNLGLLYSQGEICLFADDDVVYKDGAEQIIKEEFRNHPNADIIIFHFDTTDLTRQQKKYKRTRRHHFFERMPWGSIRIAFRRDSVKKANVWFSTLFGGGCIFPCGEDSIWLRDAQKRGLKFFVSKETIGTVSFEESSWFTGYDEKHFYGKGAYCAAMYPKCTMMWIMYYLFRYKNVGELSIKEKLRWMKNGVKGYKAMKSFDAFCNLEIN